MIDILMFKFNIFIVLNYKLKQVLNLKIFSKELLVFFMKNKIIKIKIEYINHFVNIYVFIIVYKKMITYFTNFVIQSH